MCKENSIKTKLQPEASSPNASPSNASVASGTKPSDENNAKPVPGRDDYYWSYTEEPHASRRKEILAKYPQIKELYGYDPNFKYVVIFLVVLQITTAYYVRTANWWTYLLAMYFIGGTSNHMLLLAMHELSHNTGFKKMIHNRIFSLFANLPTGVPTAISFKRYHMDHHRYQGEVDVDVDIPTRAEANVFQTTATKVMFVFFQILFYALRPMFMNPKKPGPWEFANFVCCITFDLVILYTMGIWGLVYLLGGTFLGGGMHPVAGHFIAEHYVFVKGYETYSYYGPLNIFAFNVGYHNEHHDFPSVPGSRLPEVRRIAAEFYDNLPQTESWVKVLYDYITDPQITGYSRVKRHTLSDKDLAEIRAR